MPTDRELLEAMQKDIIEIKLVLKGYDGRGGLVEKVGRNNRSIIKLWLVLTAVAASSGGGIFALSRALLGG